MKFAYIAIKRFKLNIEQKSLLNKNHFKKRIHKKLNNNNKM